MITLGNIPYAHNYKEQKTPKKQHHQTHPTKAAPRVVIFKRKFLNLLFDSDSWSWDFNVELFLLQCVIPITFPCLVVEGGRFY